MQTRSAYVLTVTAVAATLMLAGGIWALADPRSFSDFVDFPPYNRHFLHDLGAFQIGLGVTLLAATIWRDPLAVVLTGFVVANTVHAINHAVDLGLGGHEGDWISLAALSLAAAAALGIELRRGGWVVGRVSVSRSPLLEPFVAQKTVVLRTYRKNGKPIDVPVSVAVDGDRAFIRSFERGWKVLRMRNNPAVELLPSNARGEITGAPVQALARELHGGDSKRAAHLLRNKYPLLQGILVPLSHRLLERSQAARRAFGGWGDLSARGRTVHFELTPVETEKAAAPIAGAYRMTGVGD